jgi:hypothetical protein
MYLPNITFYNSINFYVYLKLFIIDSYIPILGIFYVKMIIFLCKTIKTLIVDKEILALFI